MHDGGNFFESFLKDKEAKQKVQKILQQAQIQGQIVDFSVQREFGNAFYYVTIKDHAGNLSRYRVDLDQEELS